MPYVKLFELAFSALNVSLAMTYARKVRKKEFIWTKLINLVQMNSKSNAAIVNFTCDFSNSARGA